MPPCDFPACCRSSRTSPTTTDLVENFELDHRARALVRELAILCETPTTTITELVEHIGKRHSNIHTEQAATQYLAKLATVHIASRAQMPSCTTMVQQFLGTLKLPMAIYI